MSILPFLLALATPSVDLTPHLAAARAITPPVLDGKLDDPAWARAATTDTFTQKVPDVGKPPGERTIVRVLYDKDNVYVGIDCVQTKSEIVGRLTRRDRLVEADTVGVGFDSRGDGKTAYEFNINVSGVLSDVLHFNDTDQSQDWDENWEGKAAITPTGWSAELRIPLRVLRFSSRPVQSWGMQVRRYVSARQELDEWAYIPVDAAGEVSHYGKLDDLVGLRPAAQVELRPFVVGSIRHHDPQSTALARGFEPGFSAGLDLKWHISQELTLDATFFPDFAQVEADQVVLNLTTFEQYYPEKRPFFLEGVETFNTPFQLLYTRRIGRAPEEPALVLDPTIGETLVHRPSPSTIYGAAKLVGDLGHGVSVGELVAVTARQAVDAQTLNGTRVERVADPLTTYKLLRIKKEIGDNSHVGVIAMATNRYESNPEYPTLPHAGPGGRPLELCPTGDMLDVGYRCFHDSYVAGVDGRWRSPSGDYVASGQAIATVMDKGPARTFADGTVVGSGDVGPGLQVDFSKEGGKHWVGEATYSGLGRKADYNDLGFMRRQNQHSVYARVGYRDLEPHGPVLETRTNLEYYETDNLSLLNLGRTVALKNFTRYKNFWGTYAELHWRPVHFDDREVGDGAALERAGLFGGDIYFFTDSRSVVNAELWQELHFLDNGSFTYAGDGRVSVRVLPQWDVDLLPTWFYSSGEARAFAVQGASYLFGTQRAQSFALTLRSTYTFTPRLTLQAYGQLFLDAVNYSSMTSFPANGAGTVIHVKDLKPWAGMLEANPDARSGTFNMNLVLRWEYRLGSLLYVVYTHSQSDAVTPFFRGETNGFDPRLVSPRPAEDALLAKLSYWWG